MADEPAVKTYRTIMTIRRVKHAAGGPAIRVIMGQWHPGAEVEIPLRLVPESMRAHAQGIGNMLIAQVNIEAQRSEDLVFSDFELPDSECVRAAMPDDPAAVAADRVLQGCPEGTPPPEFIKQVYDDAPILAREVRDCRRRLRLIELPKGDGWHSKYATRTRIDELCQRLDADVPDDPILDALAVLIESCEAKDERLREALEVYGDTESWDHHDGYMTQCRAFFLPKSGINKDGGVLARAALSAKPEPEKTDEN